MTPQDVFKAIGTGTFVSLLLGLLTWLSTQRQFQRETRAERIDREAAERSADLDRNDAQLRYLIQSLQQELARTNARVEMLEARVQQEQLTSGELRADLAQANITIRGLRQDNERLTARVNELEKGSC